LAAILEEILLVVQRGGVIVVIIIAISMVGWFCGLRAIAIVRVALKLDNGDRLGLGKAESLLRLVGALATVSPLLGLLGTVLGMMNAFRTVERFGVLESSFVSAGVSEALITTEAGLIVALPLLMLSFYGMHLVRSSERRIKRVEKDA
jgi:biopolymer transport protein ExbB